MSEMVGDPDEDSKKAQAKRAAARTEDDEESEDSATKALMQRLSTYLKNYGLTPFSSNVAIGYLRSQLAKPDGQHKFARVMAWLLNQLNRTNTTTKGSDQKSSADIAQYSLPSSKLPAADDAQLNLAKLLHPENNDKEYTIATSISNTSSRDKDWQSGCPNRLPGLRASPVWETRDSFETFPWVPALEASVDRIRAELISLKGQRAFQPYRSPVQSSKIESSQSQSQSSFDQWGQLATDSGSWNVSYLFLHGMNFQENIDKCPETVGMIQNTISRHYSHSLFSALSPGAHVTSHYGPTNKKLRCHLPLFVRHKGVAKNTESDNLCDSTGAGAGAGAGAAAAEVALKLCGRCAHGTPDSNCPCRSSCAWLRVADKTIEVTEGKCIIFDDSFEHEAYNGTSEPRVVLIIDIWHPQLSNEEVKFLSFLNKGQVAAAQRLNTTQQQQQQHDSKADQQHLTQNFLGVIKYAAEHGTSSVKDTDVWPFDVRND